MNQLFPIIRRARRPLLPPEEPVPVVPVAWPVPEPLPETVPVIVPEPMPPVVEEKPVEPVRPIAVNKPHARRPSPTAAAS